MSDSIAKIITRDLLKLKKEINTYTDEAILWKVEKEVNNSAGNLCMHLIGNINHYIGAIIGNNGYVRQREIEFNSKNVPVAELSIKIDDTIDMIERTLPSLSQEDLNAVFPIEVLGYKMTTKYFLIHISGHINYHLGQISYHRRLIK